MKRIVAILLATIMIFALAACDSTVAVKPQEAPVEETPQPVEPTPTPEPKGILSRFEYAGMTFNFPDEFKETIGMLDNVGGTELGKNSGIYGVDFYYLGISEEDFNALLAKIEAVNAIPEESEEDTYATEEDIAEGKENIDAEEAPAEESEEAPTEESEEVPTEEESAGEEVAEEKKDVATKNREAAAAKAQEEIDKHTAMFGSVYAVDYDRDFSAVEALWSGEGEPMDSAYAEEVGKVGHYTFYLYDAPQDRNTDNMDKEYAEEFEKLHELFVEAVRKGVYYIPLNSRTQILGETIKFKTTDLDGNDVDSEELFAQKDLTMLNIWATWCLPCVDEMGELATLEDAVGSKDFQVVGIVLDANEEDGLEKARTILEENNVEFLNLMPYDGIDVNLELQYVPTSLFIDSKGRLVDQPVIGAQVSSYLLQATSLLSDIDHGIELVPDVNNVPNDLDVYRVLVGDEAGNPVQDVVIKLSDDGDISMNETTDENGIATFEIEKGVYYVEVMSSPAEYIMDDNEYKTLDEYCDIRITLVASEEIEEPEVAEAAA